MTVRLVQVAISEWAYLDGYAVANGMGDLRELPLDRFVNFIWWFITKDREPKDIDKIRAQIWQPPRGIEIDKRSPWSPENEMAAFASIKAQISPPKKKT